MVKINAPNTTPRITFARWIGYNLLFVLSAAIALTYAGAYYHETINQHIASEYGINSTINLYLPFTYKTSEFWQGQPNKTVYTISATTDNYAQSLALAQSNPVDYELMIAQTYYNENTTNQYNGEIYNTLLPFIVVCLCSLCLFQRLLLQGSRSPTAAPYESGKYRTIMKKRSEIY